MTPLVPTVLFAVLVLFPGSSLGALATEPVVFKSGNWSVRRGTDPMTDKVSCTGIYKDQLGIQLSREELYVTIRGGIEGVTLRFDDQPAERMRLARKVEKQVSAVEISGDEFRKLLGSNRLRIEVLTLVRGIQNLDLDLTGISDAVNNIRQGCPDVLRGSSGDPLPGLCSEKVIQRLKEKGMSAKDIEYVCSPN